MLIINNRGLVALAREQLARDYNCAADNYLASADTFVEPNLNAGRRKFRPIPPRFAVSTFGDGAVISAVPEIHADMKSALADTNGIDIFAPEPFRKIEAVLSAIGTSLYVNSISYLPDADFSRQRAIDAIEKSAYTVKIYQRNDIAALYPAYDKLGFQNALMSENYRQSGLRSDAICAAAYDEEGEIAGIAGASDDSETFWQIGIDITSDNRRRGVATALVSLLTEEIFAAGAIPYYSTWSGNLFSQNVARRCGFFPAWTEASTAESE